MIPFCIFYICFLVASTVVYLFSRPAYASHVVHVSFVWQSAIQTFIHFYYFYSSLSLSCFFTVQDSDSYQWERWYHRVMTLQILSMHWVVCELKPRDSFTYEPECAAHISTSYKQEDIRTKGILRAVHNTNIIWWALDGRVALTKIHRFFLISSLLTTE